ncbi:hypothetical protein DFP72DRAFT_904558 [Ephemerocybe angulata]|uniref:F-box domain-containing protein n=1 Tax=Ephemerocybe angulata TaxID=980116 RepID=A0A8H6HTT6_9AGAR|nr:hypothetical protein DFP72DRAFT_904558 [Tulosesus angulatus]
MLSQDLDDASLYPQSQGSCHASLKSPIQALPAETLAGIFEAYIDQYRRAPWSILEHFRQRVRGIETLCLVCRTWREVAMRHAALWSNLAVPLVHAGSMAPADDPGMVLEEDAVGIRTWLGRIGATPWSLTLCRTRSSGVATTGSSEPASVVPVRDLLALDGAHLNPLDNVRFLNATFTTEGHLGDVGGLGLEGLTLPNVRGLFMGLDVPAMNREPTSLALPILPSLRQAMLMTWKLATVPHDFPWTKLTHVFLLRMITICSKDVAAILRYCAHNLQRATFSTVTANSWENIQPPFDNPSRNVDGDGLCELASLTHLTIGGVWVPEYATDMSFPNLTVLRILDRRDRGATFPFFNSDTLWQFRNVRKLSLTGEYAGLFARTLEDIEPDDGFPFLTDLYLDGNVYSVVDLASTLVFDMDEPRFPHLENLRVHCEIGELEDYRAGGWDASNDGGGVKPEERLAELVASRTGENASPDVEGGCKALKGLTVRVTPPREVGWVPAGCWQKPSATPEKKCDDVAERVKRSLEAYEEELSVEIVRGKAPSHAEFFAVDLDGWDPLFEEAFAGVPFL